MISISLNPQGRLIELAAVPAQVEAPAGSAPPSWAALFTAAGLDLTRFTPVEPEWLPLVSFDARAAWTGVYPATDVPLRIEAASWRGRPVNFQMIAPWTNPARMHQLVTSYFVPSVIWLSVLALKPASRRPTEPASRKSFTPTPCGTALPLTCSKPVPTCARSNYCWATAIWKRPRSICTSPSAISTPPRVRWMRCR